MDKKLPSKIANIVLIVVIISVSFITVLFKSDPHFKVSDALSQKDAALMKNTQVQSVIKSLGTSNTNTSVPGLSPTMDPNGWYTDLNGMKGSTAGESEIAGFKVYTQPPWDATKNTFFFNAYKAKLELYDYLVSLGVNNKVLQGSRSFSENNSFTRFGDGIDSIGRKGKQGRTSAGILYCEVDGQKCIYVGPMPAAIDKNYYSSGNWKKMAWSPGYNWQTWKGCLVLVKKGNDCYDSKNYIYMPCVAGSAKGHTYPWGVTQTHIAIANNKRVNWPTGGKVSQHWAGGMDLNDAGSEADIKKALTTFNLGNTNSLSYLYCTAEVCGISSNALKLLSNNYIAVGFVSYN